MRQRTPWVIAFLALLASILSGTSRPATASLTAGSTATDRAAVETAMQAYAVLLRSTQAAKIAAFYAADGELQLPGMAPLHGPAAIQAFLAPMAGTYEVASVDVATDLLEVQGDTASQWGTYRQVVGEHGKPKQHLRGRYAALWHKEKDGHWRLQRLMMQPLPPDLPK